MSAPVETPNDLEKKVDFQHNENAGSDDIHHIKAYNNEPKISDKAVDDSANILREAGDLEFTVEEDRRVLRKIDLWVLTPMMLIYTLQQMDKSSISYAAVFGIQEATGLHGYQYAMLTSILYIAQLLWQPMSSYALVRLPLSKWITGNVLCWGIVVMCMAAAHNFTGLMITRFLLGVFEATVSPTFVAITQLWWRRREQSFRTTMWLIANSLAAVFGPLLSYAIGHVHSGIKPHQGIFLFLGALTIGAVPVLFYMLPDDIAHARFLTPREKAIAVERLRANNTGTKTSTWKWEQCREAFADPKTWGWALLLMVTAIPSGGFSAFGGLITKGFGFSALNSILFQMPIGIMQISILGGGTWLINRIKMRWPVIATICVFPIGGAIGMIFVNRSQPKSLLGCYYVTMLLGCIQPLLYSWANLNAAGTTKQRTIGGIMFVGQCLGNIIGPQVYLAREKPYYHTGLYVDIACWIIDLVGIISMGLYLTYLNRKQEKRRIALGRAGKKVDVSIMTLEEAAVHKAEMEAEAAARGEVLDENAFDDLTDLQNPDFIYVI